MKSTLFAILVSVISVTTFAQSNNEVKWTFTAKKIADKTFEVHLTATVNGDWHIYSQSVGVDGPIPTSFSFTKNPLIGFDGKVTEVGKLIKKNEEVWGGEVRYYEKTVDFVQKVVLRGGKTKLAGKIEYMVCNNEKCLPPAETTFSVAIGG